ncbi:endophilin-B2-like [Poecilia reticulata]|uniref:endophilin-B2-like n=1 Tax=Poecilia reticulata TaxID=8081 RepID=UPI0004A463F4|nr:PREDICTED: endophilin-B2-like [Poecilia reticulata]
MDFNVKKLASGAGLFFTRAVQYTEEKLGQAERTELDAHFENLMSRADCTKHWTEKIYRQTEYLLQPNPIDHTGEYPAFQSPCSALLWKPFMLCIISIKE